MTQKKKARGIKVAAASLAMVVGSGAALAATIPGTNAGEVLRGTNRADTISGYGGADLIYGRGGGDTVWGGNEAGWGDKVLGGTGGDRLVGQQGDDALYGEDGNDTLEGQYDDDLLVGGPGEDTLNGGPGADEVDARDSRRDVIDLTGSGSGDVVYYDRGIDEFVTSSVESVDESSGAAEAARATGAGFVEEGGSGPLLLRARASFKEVPSTLLGNGGRSGPGQDALVSRALTHPTRWPPRKGVGSTAARWEAPPRPSSKAWAHAVVPAPPL